MKKLIFMKKLTFYEINFFVSTPLLVISTIFIKKHKKLFFKEKLFFIIVIKKHEIVAKQLLFLYGIFNIFMSVNVHISKRYIFSTFPPIDG